MLNNFQLKLRYKKFGMENTTLKPSNILSNSNQVKLKNQIFKWIIFRLKKESRHWSRCLNQLVALWRIKLDMSKNMLNKLCRVWASVLTKILIYMLENKKCWRRKKEKMKIMVKIAKIIKIMKVMLMKIINKMDR